MHLRLVGLCFSPPDILLVHNDKHAQSRAFLRSNQLPRVGEWTRIEISHEEEDGKYFLSLSVAGKEVGREEVDDPQLRNLTGVKVTLGHAKELTQPGFIRRLVVLEK